MKDNYESEYIEYPYCEFEPSDLEMILSAKIVKQTFLQRVIEWKDKWSNRIIALGNRLPPLPPRIL